MQVYLSIEHQIFVHWNISLGIEFLDHKKKSYA